MNFKDKKPASGRFKPSASPWGPDDQKGAINRITPQSRDAIVSRLDGRKVYDLSVDYFVGMPGYVASGDPAYQAFMSHTPKGTVVDDLNGAGRKVNACCAYSGDVILMYTHTGTHIDALNHFGYRDEIYNNYSADEHLGSRGWTKNGAEQIDPIIARGILLDVAGHKGMECLPPSYGITSEDLEMTCSSQGVEIKEGDVVLIRTGRMRYWPDGDKVFGDSPGLVLESAKWITSKGIVSVGADNEAVEKTPADDPDLWLPVHCHLLAEAGVTQMECLNLEELAADKLYEIGFIGAPIRLRGATGTPLRPLAFPLR